MNDLGLIATLGVDGYLKEVMALTDLIIESGKNIDSVIDALPDDDVRKVMYRAVMKEYGE